MTTIHDSYRTGPHQSRERPPSQYEVQLARTIEDIFSTGTPDRAGLVARLDASGVSPPSGGHWTESSLTELMHELGA